MNRSVAVRTLTAHARALGDRIVETAGAASLRAVFVGGSVASGAVSWAAFDGVAEIYSDIDLYVVVSASGDGDAVRDAARSAVGSVAVPGDMLMTRPVDIGVYDVEDLLSQPARPGTVALAERHLHLWGDEEIYGALRARIGTEVHPGEALYLIENRLAQVASTPGDGDPAAQRLAAVLRLKTYLDVAMAYKIAAREADAPPDHADLCARAAKHLDGLDGYLHGPRDRELESRAEATAVAAWKRLAAEHFGLPEDEWMAMVERRCQRGQHAGNFRQFVAMRRRMGRTRPKSMWEGMHLATFAPIDALRVASLVEAARRGGPGDDAAAPPGAYEAFVERLTGTCGFVEGTMATRARAMHRAVA